MFTHFTAITDVLLAPFSRDSDRVKLNKKHTCNRENKLGHMSVVFKSDLGSSEYVRHKQLSMKMKNFTAALLT